MDRGTLVQKKTSEIYDLFEPVEGFNKVYYGRVRNGKTYAATADIIELLKRGEIVYANWEIKFDDYDERTDFWTVFLKFVSGRKYFYKFDSSNFHYFHPDSIDIEFLGKLVGVHVFIDEGQWIFNSHIREKAEDPEAVAKRRLILHGGHYCRSLNVITQRPINLFKDIRSQINIWYKCEKRLQFGRFILFQRWEYQDMKNDEPDEEFPVGRPKTYVASDKIFNAYNTHGMRGDDAIVEPPVFDAYVTTRLDRFFLLLSFFVPRWSRKLKRAPAQADKIMVNRTSLRDKMEGFEARQRVIDMVQKKR